MPSHFKISDCGLSVMHKQIKCMTGVVTNCVLKLYLLTVIKRHKNYCLGLTHLILKVPEIKLV